jgi:hypothetical protein
MLGDSARAPPWERGKVEKPFHFAALIASLPSVLHILDAVTSSAVRASMIMYLGVFR